MKAYPDDDMNFPNGRPADAQPKWRHDFPIDVQADEYGARRDFTKFMVLTSLAFVVGQVWIGVQSLFRRRPKPSRRRIARLDDIPVGEAFGFSYPTERDSCLLIRVSANAVHAYSDQCTHLMCPVQPQVARGRLHCPCHEGYFDLESGRPLSGPPRRALPRIVLQVDGGVVYATGIEVGNS